MISDEQESTVDSIHNTKNNLKSKALVSKTKRQILRNVWLVRLTILVVIVSVLVGVFLGVKKLIANTSLPYYGQLAHNFLFPDKNKLNIINGEVNFVILGRGGQGHDAPDLTDTIMFVSVDTVNKSIRVVSLPRDIWIASLRAKLNSAYYWGNKKQPGGGLTLAKSTIEEVVGQPVSYALVLDFSGFKDIIDAMGGIEVNVQEAFVDPEYPIAGRENDECGGDRTYKCRYETLEFKQGSQHMDGTLALKFVRSRHAEGDQGTDIARAARQQLVLEAIKEKLVSKDLLTSPQTLNQLFLAVKGALQTDLSDDQLAVLAKYIYEARSNAGNARIPDGLLINPPISRTYDNQYVFVPTSGNWEELHQWIKTILAN